MKPRLFSASLLAAAAFLSLAQPCRADLFYWVTLDVPQLTSAGASGDGPFSLDFQLNYGSGSTNTVTLSNFSFSGVGAGSSGSATDSGTATGSLSSTVSLSASSTHQFNELFQQFTAGTESITFEVDASTNSSGATPTSFDVGILDNDLYNIPSDASDGQSLLIENFTSTNTIANLQLATSTNDGSYTTAGITPEVSAVPEGGPGIVVLLALCGTVVLVRRHPRLSHPCLS